MYKEATPAENKAAGNVQPVKSPQQQATQQLTGGGQQPQKPLNPGSGFMYGSGDPNATLGEDLGTYAQRTLEGLGSVGMGIIDFGMDAIGRIPGAEWIDDTWDAKTKFKNPGFQKVREVSSVLVPAIGVGAASRIGTAGMAGGPVARGLSSLGINVAGDVAINAISDQSEGETVSTIVKEAAPWLPVPDALVVKDTDSPEARRQKNIYESAGISIVGDIIGYSMAAGRGVMDWFKPNDTAAKEFMSSEVMVNADAATATRLSEINTQLDELNSEVDRLRDTPSEGEWDLAFKLAAIEDIQSQTKALQSELDRITKQYTNTGSSDLTESPLESFVERQQVSRDSQIDEVGKGRLMDDPEGAGGVDPMVTPTMFPEGSTAALSIPPGNIARNMADTTAIKLGTTSGTPAPILSERA